MFSIIAGTFASFLPNMMFVWLGRLHHNKTPSLFIRFFYLSECLKFVGFVVVFSTFLLWLDLNVKIFVTAVVMSEFTRLSYLFFKLARATRY